MDVISKIVPLCHRSGRFHGDNFHGDRFSVNRLHGVSFRERQPSPGATAEMVSMVTWKQQPIRTSLQQGTNQNISRGDPDVGTNHNVSLAGTQTWGPIRTSLSRDLRFRDQSEALSGGDPDVGAALLLDDRSHLVVNVLETPAFHHRCNTSHKDIVVLQY